MTRTAVVGLVGLVGLVACKPPPPPTPPPQTHQTRSVSLAAVRADLVSPITASGRETPDGLDWGDQGKQPAKTLFKNVQLLGELSGDRVMAAMQSMESNLGHRCKLCHDPNDWPSDGKHEKPIARRMIQMAADLNRQFFAGKPRITCFTCHLGHPHPPEAKDPASSEIRQPVTNPPPAIADADTRSAEQVYKNIRVFRGMPAKQVLFIMGLFTADLGVPCAHCHDERDWSADTKPAKQRAREMMSLVGVIKTTYFPDENQSPIGCMSCHRGRVKPPRTPRDPH